MWGTAITSETSFEPGLDRRLRILRVMGHLRRAPLATSRERPVPSTLSLRPWASATDPPRGEDLWMVGLCGSRPPRAPWRRTGGLARVGSSTKRWTARTRDSSHSWARIRRPRDPALAHRAWAEVRQLPRAQPRSQGTQRQAQKPVAHGGEDQYFHPFHVADPLRLLRSRATSAARAKRETPTHTKERLALHLMRAREVSE